MAVAVRQQEQSGPRPVKKRRRQSVRPVTGLRCAVAIVALAGLTGYVGLYAKITQNGFYKAKLTAELKASRTQNQYLRADLQMLSCPDRLSAAAVQANMVPSQNVQYVHMPGSVRIARAGSGDE